MFSVWPMAERAATEHNTDSGIEVAMMIVERQEPRKSRIINAVSAAAMTPSRMTPEMAAFTKTDWSLMRLILKPGGMVARMPGMAFFTPCTTESVEPSPVFRIEVSTARLPSTCTMLCCGGEPSRTLPTSRI